MSHIALHVATRMLTKGASLCMSAHVIRRVQFLHSFIITVGLFYRSNKNILHIITRRDCSGECIVMSETTKYSFCGAALYCDPVI